MRRRGPCSRALRGRWSPRALWTIVAHAARIVSSPGSVHVTLTVLFFAQAREHAGRPSESLELPEGSRVSDALAAIRRAHPALDPLWPHLAVAVNGRLTPPETTLAHGAELALLPPVSGG